MLESMVHEVKVPFLSALTENIHILPDFHGNRYVLNEISSEFFPLMWRETFFFLGEKEL